MATLEHVERLRERANVTYEEAKEALDACGDDLLDAIIYLENNGKVASPEGGGSYKSSQTGQDEHGHKSYKTHTHTRGQTVATVFGRILRFLGRLVHRGNINNFEVWRDGALVFSMPVTVLVLLLIFMNIAVPILAIVGLFFRFRYRFSGKDFDGGAVNNAMAGAADAAESFKEEIRASMESEDDAKK